MRESGSRFSIGRSRSCWRFSSIGPSGHARCGRPRRSQARSIRAAATLSDSDEIVVVGSQAILGQFPDAPAELLRSMEAGVYSRAWPSRSDLIDGSIGEGSPFHQTFGYYAQGVAPETALLPPGWEERAIRVYSPATRGATGLALEVHDLLVSKYAAGREKDREFARAVFRLGMARARTVLELLPLAPLGAERLAAALAAVEADARQPQD